MTVRHLILKADVRSSSPAPATFRGLLQHRSSDLLCRSSKSPADISRVSASGTHTHRLTFASRFQDCITILDCTMLSCAGGPEERRHAPGCSGADAPPGCTAACVLE